MRKKQQVASHAIKLDFLVVKQTGHIIIIFTSTEEEVKHMLKISRLVCIMEQHDLYPQTIRSFSGISYIKAQRQERTGISS